MGSGRSALHDLWQATHQYSGQVCCCTVSGTDSRSTCWTIRARPPLRRSGPPQQGQPCRGCSKKRLTCSAGKGARSCLGWPGCPPRERWSRPGGGGGGGGLTMSDEGGLEEVEEFLRAPASCSSRRATVACR